MHIIKSGLEAVTILGDGHHQGSGSSEVRF